MRPVLQRPEETGNPGRFCPNNIRRCLLVQSSVLVMALVVSWPLHCRAEDAYLSELAAEVEKVEERAIDGTADDEYSGDAAEGATDADREAFERQLKKHYLGSYGFYRKLPERSRQEVFEEYRQGADMKELRRKIINRLLHH